MSRTGASGSLGAVFRGSKFILITKQGTSKCVCLDTSKSVEKKLKLHACFKGNNV